MRLSLTGILFMALLASGAHVFAATDAVAAVEFSVFNRANAIVFVWQYDDRIKDKEFLAAFWPDESKPIVATKKHLIFIAPATHQPVVETPALFMGRGCFIYQKRGSVIGEYGVLYQLYVEGVSEAVF